MGVVQAAGEAERLEAGSRVEGDVAETVVVDALGDGSGRGVHDEADTAQVIGDESVGVGALDQVVRDVDLFAKAAVMTVDQVKVSDLMHIQRSGRRAFRFWFIVRRECDRLLEEVLSGMPAKPPQAGKEKTPICGYLNALRKSTQAL